MQRDRSPENGPYSELYREFVDYIGTDIQRERRVANRRMFSVFLWGFVMPAAVSAILILLLRIGYLPHRVGRHIDWLIVIFPVAYALYMLSFDVLKELPLAVRRGGIAATLNRALEEERWRARVYSELKQRFLQESSKQRVEGWRWVVQNFRTDLKNMQNRTRYLTALAGAVFFLIFQGVDAMDVSHHDSIWSAGSIMGWFEASTSNLTQFVGLGIFLMLLYVSGNQVFLALARYHFCSALLLQEHETEREPIELDISR